mmetsp:Transcript_18030/g.50429  ORF Transcript_18030/g.50429 Transcript_18030/m.50429 type:complete len:1057 (+) Transcript_18030:294-3464(+)
MAEESGRVATQGPVGGPAPPGLPRCNRCGETLSAADPNRPRVRTIEWLRVEAASRTPPSLQTGQQCGSTSPVRLPSPEGEVHAVIGKLSTGAGEHPHLLRFHGSSGYCLCVCPSTVPELLGVPVVATCRAFITMVEHLAGGKNTETEQCILEITSVEPLSCPTCSRTSAAPDPPRPPLAAAPPSTANVQGKGRCPMSEELPSGGQHGRPPPAPVATVSGSVVAVSPAMCIQGSWICMAQLKPVQLGRPAPGLSELHDVMFTGLEGVRWQPLMASALANRSCAVRIQGTQPSRLVGRGTSAGRRVLRAGPLAIVESLGALAAPYTPEQASSLQGAIAAGAPAVYDLRSWLALRAAHRGSGRQGQEAAAPPAWAISYRGTAMGTGPVGGCILLDGRVRLLAVHFPVTEIPGLHNGTKVFVGNAHVYCSPEGELQLAATTRTSISVAGFAQAESAPLCWAAQGPTAAAVLACQRLSFQAAHAMIGMLERLQDGLGSWFPRGTKDSQRRSGSRWLRDPAAEGGCEAGRLAMRGLLQAVLVALGQDPEPEAVRADIYEEFFTPPAACPLVHSYGGELSRLPEVCTVAELQRRAVAAVARDDCASCAVLGAGKGAVLAHQGATLCSNALGSPGTVAVGLLTCKDGQLLLMDDTGEAPIISPGGAQRWLPLLNSVVAVQRFSVVASGTAAPAGAAASDGISPSSAAGQQNPSRFFPQAVAVAMEAEDVSVLAEAMDLRPSAVIRPQPAGSTAQLPARMAIMTVTRPPSAGSLCIGCVSLPLALVLDHAGPKRATGRPTANHQAWPCSLLLPSCQRQEAMPAIVELTTEPTAFQHVDLVLPHPFPSTPWMTGTWLAVPVNPCGSANAWSVPPRALCLMTAQDQATAHHKLFSQGASARTLETLLAAVGPGEELLGIQRAISAAWVSLPPTLKSSLSLAPVRHLVARPHGGSVVSFHGRVASICYATGLTPDSAPAVLADGSLAPLFKPLRPRTPVGSPQLYSLDPSAVGQAGLLLQVRITIEDCVIHDKAWASLLPAAVIPSPIYEIPCSYPCAPPVVAVSPIF